MNPKVKPLWTVALRSDDFKQGKYKLRTHEDKYCCLGVLGHLAVAAGAIPEPEFYSSWKTDSGRGEWEYDGDACGLAPALREWAGLTHDSINDLISLNDGQGKSFSEIADWIDENL